MFSLRYLIKITAGYVPAEIFLFAEIEKFPLSSSLGLNISVATYPFAENPIGRMRSTQVLNAVSGPFFNVIDKFAES